jgi:hypothetical protein
VLRDQLSASEIMIICAVQRIVNQLDMLQHSLYPIASTLPQKKTVERPAMARFVRKTKEGPLLRVSEK